MKSPNTFTTNLIMSDLASVRKFVECFITPLPRLSYKYWPITKVLYREPYNIFCVFPLMSAVIFIATFIRKVVLTKKWNVNNCKIKISKKFTQSETLCWIIFDWSSTNATLNRHLLVGAWHINTFKSALTLLLIRNRVLAKNKEITILHSKR